MIRRDRSFELEIKNQSVGVNVITLPDDKSELTIVTPLIK